MARTVGIGHQSFEEIITKNLFYIDKTMFLKQWWENEDVVTLITRPRRFGKTLTMSMVEAFFSARYANRSELFEGLWIWQNEEIRKLQGTYPVISLSFANVKENSYDKARKRISQILTELYNQNRFLLEGDFLSDEERCYFLSVSMDMPEVVATMAIHRMCGFLSRYYGKKVIILLDEYDTPMQEAYVDEYWDKLVYFTRSLFNAAFKTNPYLEKAIMTGITRVSKESVFSDLNNLEVVTTTSSKYGEIFGFTETEVFNALDEYGLSDSKRDVKAWYDGFIFGQHRDIYNPWSITNFIEKKQLSTYWANTSSNSLVGRLIRQSDRTVKQSFEELMDAKTVKTTIDEQIVYSQLDDNITAIWSLLLASGYLKVERHWIDGTEYGDWLPVYELSLTNFEVRLMFRNMIRGWFRDASAAYNDFIKALLLDDVDAMNDYMNRVALTTFSSFDAGKKPSEEDEPERFYHGFVLGLMVDLADRYILTSNRESGFGRYDVMLEPRRSGLNAVVIEFKVFNRHREKTLEDTVQAALKQIEDKKYCQTLMDKGISKENIRCYGFAFEGKNVLIARGMVLPHEALV